MLKTDLALGRTADGRPGRSLADARRGQLDDGMTVRSPADILWTRCNTGEAMPGVMNPVAWSYYAYAVEVGCRQAYYDLGLVPKDVLEYPARVEDCVLVSFHGRQCEHHASHLRGAAERERRRRRARPPRLHPSRGGRCSLPEPSPGDGGGHPSHPHHRSG